MRMRKMILLAAAVSSVAIAVGGPAWGCSSEDPFFGGLFTSAAERGIQGFPITDLDAQLDFNLTVGSFWQTDGQFNPALIAEIVDVDMIEQALGFPEAMRAMPELNEMVAALAASEQTPEGRRKTVSKMRKPKGRYGDFDPYATRSHKVLFMEIDMSPRTGTSSPTIDDADATEQASSPLMKNKIVPYSKAEVKYLKNAFPFRKPHGEMGAWYQSMADKLNEKFPKNAGCRTASGVRTFFYRNGGDMKTKRPSYLG